MGAVAFWEWRNLKKEAPEIDSGVVNDIIFSGKAVNSSNCYELKMVRISFLPIR